MSSDQHDRFHGAAMPLSDRFDDALAYASRLHREQTRKGSDIPYVAHLLAVCSLVIEHGGNEDQAIAALLHDAAEDQGGEPRLSEIRARYGAAVADIVADCTDAWTEPKPPWRPRKEAYLAALPSKPSASLLVSLADKVHNASAILGDYQVLGDKLWDRFKGGLIPVSIASLITINSAIASGIVIGYFTFPVKILTRSWTASN
jgi:(p)ppGpp synthase/HD superfamily hydrolase